VVEGVGGGRLVNATGRRSVTSNHIAPYPRKIKRKERSGAKGGQGRGGKGRKGWRKRDKIAMPDKREMRI